MSEQLIDWGKEIETATLPRWKELPDIELYMDQVISLVGKYLTPILPKQEQALLTKSMLNPTCRNRFSASRQLVYN